MFELGENAGSGAIIRVVGVGGGGGNAIEHMITEKVDGVEFIVANTDAQALTHSKASTVLQLGEEITKGLGAGADPNVGRQSAEADRSQIEETLRGADMVFITAGMGGGTGTGAAPVFAEVARELGILTVAVVTKPFSFEGRKRMNVAEAGIQAIGRHVDSLITIPNDKLLSVLGEKVTLLDAFKSANSVLQGAVEGIANLITCSGLINVDFADVRAVMSEMGMAMMGTGESSGGENRAKEAAQAAIRSPLLEDIDLTGARGVLVNVTAGLDMSIGEFQSVGDVIKEFTSPDATVVVGTVIDPELKDVLKVTVVVTGLGGITGREGEVEAQPASKNIQDTLKDNTQSDGKPDYDRLSQPTVIRNQPEKPKQNRISPDKLASELDKDINYLDIPAFLRRQEAETQN